MEGTRKLLVGKIQQVVTNLGGEEEEGEQGWGPQPGESVGDFFLKQLHYLLHLPAAFWAFLVDKFNQVMQPPEIIYETLHKWAHYLLHLLAAFWAFLVDKFNQVLPPETRDETLHKWAHIGLTRVLPIGLALLVFYWCCRTGCCCRMMSGAGRMMSGAGRMMSRMMSGAGRMMSGAGRMAGRMMSGAGRMMSGGAGRMMAGRMMRAPGRMGVFMLRATFEANPGGYFRGLRA